MAGLGTWLGEHDPTIESFANVTHDHCLAFLQSLVEQPSSLYQGRPLCTLELDLMETSGLSMFFHDTAAWGWDRRMYRAAHYWAGVTLQGRQPECPVSFPKPNSPSSWRPLLSWSAHFSARLCW